jgi:hypothetical protein
MKIITLFAILILTCFCTYSQNLIGYNGREIKKYMRENLREMNYENVTNSKFKYLKYSDNYDNQTLLFFLNSDSVCNSVKMICDLSMKTAKVKEFNTIYKKKSENIWIDNRDGKDYLIQMDEGKWSCIIKIEPDK